MKNTKQRPLWTRREALAAGAAAGAAVVLPAFRAEAAAGFPPDALRPYVRRVGTDRIVASIGRAAAGTRDAHALEAALRARIPGAHDEAGWRARLLAAGREDVARGDFVEVAGRQLMRVEADFLGLAALLQPEA